MGRILGAIELLAGTPDGMALAAVADGLDMPKSGAHRLLQDLIGHGWARAEPGGRYVLTTRLVRHAFRFLAGACIDLAQPILERLAVASGELVRLAVVDGEGLTWVAKAQGARAGLRYDPEMGQDVILPVTASGHAWLCSLDEAAALRIAAAAGFPKLTDSGPAAPRTIGALAARLRAARRDGLATVTDSGGAGTAAMAAGIVDPRTGAVVATVSIAGPSVRLTPARMQALAGALRAAAEELAAITGIADVFADGSAKTGPRRQQGA